MYCRACSAFCMGDPMSFERVASVFDENDPRWRDDISSGIVVPGKGFCSDRKSIENDPVPLTSR